MTTPSTPDLEELAARLAALEAENARLREQSASTAPDRPASSGRWRAVVSAICIVVAAILVPVSIVAAWARVELVDEERFVATLAPLAQDAAVQDFVADQVTDAIDERVDFAGLVDPVFDGIAGLDLPPRSAQALELLRGPAASGLQGLVESNVEAFVRSDAFADLFGATLRATHRALTTVATSDGGGLVVQTPDGLGIQLGAVVDAVRQRLIDNGVGLASVIPEVDRIVIVGTGDNVRIVRAAYGVAVTVGWWMPVITLALFIAGILLARRRSTAVLGSGIGLAVGAGALGILFAVGSSVVSAVGATADVPPRTIDAVYQQLVADMSQTAWVLALLGVVIAVSGWITGDGAAAVRTRGMVEGVNDAARAALAGHGLDTGAFGVWLARYRVWVRATIVALAVVWLLLLRPLSAGEIFSVIVVALVVGWVLEILQRRPVSPDASQPV